LYVALVALWVSSVRPVGAAEEAKQLVLKEGSAKIGAELGDGDAKDKVRNQFCKRYVINLKGGHAYQIDMMSNDIDAYLRLEDAAGKELAKDDDGGEGFNARIRFGCPGDGSYRIIATTFGGGTGTFTLAVKEVTTLNAASLAFNGGVAKVESDLSNNDERDAARNNSPCKVFITKLEQGKRYQIDMTSSTVDSYLRLEDSTGKELAHDDDSGGGRNARIRFACPKNGTYRIIATSFGGGAGPFSLVVTTSEEPKLVLQNGEAKIEAELSDSDTKDSLRKASYCKVYTLQLTMGKTYQIDMRSNRMDSYLRLEGGGGAQVAEDDDSGGALNARIVFNCAADGTYRIVATTLAGGTGPFSLTVREK
jgi:hypothetical protein